jgi:hypothetical protein
MQLNVMFRFERKAKGAVRCYACDVSGKQLNHRRGWRTHWYALPPQGPPRRRGPAKLHAIPVGVISVIYRANLGSSDTRP